jgi:malonate transporter
MEVITSLISILIVVLLGIISRRAGIFKAEHAKTLSSFVYYFGLPTLFYVKISGLDFYSLDIRFLLGTLLPTTLLLVLLLALKLIRILPRDTYILLSLSISLGNYAFFGIAFFETFQGGKWLDAAVLAASLLGILGITTTLLLLEYANQKKQVGSMLTKIFTNPLILSILLGTVASLIGFHPAFLNDAFSLVGKTSGAVAIFVLGMFINDRFSLQLIKDSLGYALFRTLALPLVAWLVIIFLIPGRVDYQPFLLLENGMPAAVALVVFAERYDYKVSETAGIVSLTSFFSFGGLTALFYLWQSFH